VAGCRFRARLLFEDTTNDRPCPSWASNPQPQTKKPKMLQSNNHSPFLRTFLIHVLRIKSSVSTVELCRMLKTSFRNPTLLSELAVVFSIRNTKENNFNGEGWFILTPFNNVILMQVPCCCIKWNSATNATETNYNKRPYTSIRTKLSLKTIALNTTRTYINVR
jgi:hypothetical protein